MRCDEMRLHWKIHSLVLRYRTTLSTLSVRQTMSTATVKQHYFMQREVRALFRQDVRRTPLSITTFCNVTSSTGKLRLSIDDIRCPPRQTLPTTNWHATTAAVHRKLTKNRRTHQRKKTKMSDLSVNTNTTRETVLADDVTPMWVCNTRTLNK